MEDQNLNPKDNNSEESIPEINKENIKEKNVNEFTEFLEKASEKKDLNEKLNHESSEKKN